MDYSKTVNLPVTDFPMKADLPKREPAMLALWEKEQVYQRALAQRLPSKESKRFILHDGPPYANGHLHLGHALNKILKDIIVRFKTMTGHYAPYVPGWDCHGLPIELQLMKELKVTDKHKVDRTVFRGQAKAFAEKFVTIQRDEFKRLGVLGDWDHPYLTMDEDYKKTIVSTFEELRDKGYIYRGKKPVYWCTTDETALAEAEVEYENRTDRAIYVAFPTVKPGLFYGVWTTTPWTLPANVAIAYSPTQVYVRLQDQTAGREYIVAQERVEAFQTATGLSLTSLGTLAHDQFPVARHPWIDRASAIIPADFVTMDTGTGLVHIAPGHGADDFVVGQKNKLPTLSPINDKGLFTDEVPEWKGEHVFKANPLIIEFLKTKGLLLLDESITHSYPHCWRCHRPVIFRATEQWFLKIDHEGLRERALKALEQVSFYPDFGRKRISGMMSTRPDWCLSRQRLWGTEIPGGSSTTADPDIFDVWFESGVSWRAVLEARPELHQPADMYLEGSDQHRGWFQVSLIPSVALENKAPFKALLTHGFVMDGAGRPMSKSVGNVISPEEIIKQYGADLLRLWVASSDYSGDVRLSPEILKGLTDTYRKIRNTFRYLLGNAGGVPVTSVAFADRPELDQWALAQLREVSEKVTSSFEKFEFHRGVSALVDFCGSTLSGFYLDTLKDRLYCDPVESLSGRSARSVLSALADTLCRLWAPVLSFTADEAWRALGHTESVALSDTPILPAEWTTPDHVELFRTRHTILAALEKARQAGRIKGNLEANVILFSSGEKKQAWLKLNEARWPLWCIVSQARVSSDPLPQSDASEQGVDVFIERAAGQKCARCWIYKIDVGVDAQYTDICTRCAEAVHHREQLS